ncbi:hypothetical protein ACVIGB_006820 [Bradyrhizobium sp. USDA 4341]
MHPRLAIKSATVAGIAASALFGLAGLTLNPVPANAVVYCQVALPGLASCYGLVRWRARRSGTTPVAMQMVAPTALGHGGKALVCVLREGTAVPARGFLVGRRQATLRSDGIMA